MLHIAGLKNSPPVGSQLEAKVAIMDLQSVYFSCSPAWRLTRLLAFSCFVAACGLLIGSLSAQKKFQGGLDLQAFYHVVQSES